ncbi:MAG TPA: NIPSNAP family protein [Janthinobacterium sp.]|nr:NIPSNAP family protein [Janthinobacterium sp.]
MKHIIEIRTYRLKAGTAQQFHALMREQSLPLLRAAGTEVLAARPCLDAADAYVLMRAYPSLAQRSLSQDAFYAGAAWLEGPRAAIMACIDTYSSVVIEADRGLRDSLRDPTP